MAKLSTLSPSPAVFTDYSRIHSSTTTKYTKNLKLELSSVLALPISRPNTNYSLRISSSSPKTPNPPPPPSTTPPKNTSTHHHPPPSPPKPQEPKSPPQPPIRPPTPMMTKRRNKLKVVMIMKGTLQSNKTTNKNPQKIIWQPRRQKTRKKKKNEMIIKKCVRDHLWILIDNLKTK